LDFYNVFLLCPVFHLDDGFYCNTHFGTVFISCGGFASIYGRIMSLDAGLLELFGGIKDDSVRNERAPSLSLYANPCQTCDEIIFLMLRLSASACPVTDNRLPCFPVAFFGSEA